MQPIKEIFMQKAKLYLEDIFDINWDLVKIKFNQPTPAGQDPLEIWQYDHEEINNKWLFWEENKNRLQVGQFAISLVDMKKDKWLLTTVKKITEVLPVQHGVHYRGEEVKEYKPYFGRLVVYFHKSDRTGIRIANTLKQQIEVLELLPEEYNGDQFPGYNKVHLSWYQLEHIFNCKKPDWLNALSQQKGVYLITDNKTGKLYVGSASGNTEGLWQRWEQYVKNGHGGNKGLKNLNFDYIKQYFSYSILENYNFNTGSDVILERENWWKEVLATTKHGYNTK